MRPIRPASRLRVLPFVPAAFLLAWCFGCRAPKETWADWMAQRPAVEAAAPRQGETVAAIEASAVELAVESGPEPAVEPLPPYDFGQGARVGSGFDLAMRNPDFPKTYIEAVQVDLTGPNHWVRVRWTGPLAELGPVGPWPSSPGRGAPGCDCDDVEVSNSVDSLCTPKGSFPVPGFSDQLELVPTCHYVTWVVHAPRYIALHSHRILPARAASHGCIRLPAEAAKLIHNNSRVGLTRVNIDGHWRPPLRRY